MKHLQSLFGAALMFLITALAMVGCGNIDNPLEEIGSNSSSESTPTPPAFNAKGTPLTFEAAGREGFA